MKKSSKPLQDSFASALPAEDELTIMETNDYLVVSNISASQWAQIRALSIQINDSGRHNGDQMKSAIDGFLLWLGDQDKEFAYASGDNEIKKGNTFTH